MSLDFTRRSCAVAVSILCAAACAHAGAPIEAIATSDTLIPGRADVFDDFGMPRISGGNVVFAAEDDSNLEGVYGLVGSTLVVFFDETTGLPTPSGAAMFDNANAPWIDGDRVVVDARRKSPSERWVLGARAGETPEAVANGDTPLPGRTPGAAPLYFNAAARDGRIVFSEGGAQGPTIYFGDEQSGFARVVDGADAVPGPLAATFTTFFNPVPVGAGGAVFWAQSSTGSLFPTGVYHADTSSSTVTPLADVFSVAPGTGGQTFSSLVNDRFDARGDYAALVGRFGADDEGVFATTISGGASALTPIALPTDLIPGTNLTIADLDDEFEGVATDGQRVVIAIDKYLLLSDDGDLSVLLGPGDEVVPGVTPLIVRVASGAFEGDHVAIEVFGTGGHKGVYRVTVPAPASSALLIAAMAGVRRRRAGR